MVPGDVLSGSQTVPSVSGGSTSTSKYRLSPRDSQSETRLFHPLGESDGVLLNSTLSSVVGVFVF